MNSSRYSKLNSLRQSLNVENYKDKFENNINDKSHNNSLNQETLRDLLFSSINFTNKNIPTIIAEYEEALKKSNLNVTGLKEQIFLLLDNETQMKERVNQLEQIEDDYNNIKYKYSGSNFNTRDIINYKAKYEELIEDFKTKKDLIEELENEKNILNKEIIENDRLIEDKNEIISSLKKTLNSINIIQHDDLEFEDDLKFIKLDLTNEKTTNKELTLIIEKMKNHEKKYLTEKNRYKEKIKKYKEDLKEELNEKIIILKELEKLRGNQMTTKDRESELRDIYESNENKKDTLRKEKNELLITIDEQQIKIESLILETEEYKRVPDNNILKELSKLEDENFEIKCETNMWKAAFSEMVKYKILNLKFDYNKLNDLVRVDKYYLDKLPNHLQEKFNYLILYFKKLFEEDNNEPVDMIHLKRELLSNKQNLIEISEDYQNEINLRRNLHNRYMNIRGNLRIMSRIRPFVLTENNEINKKSFRDTIKVFNDSVTINDRNKLRKYDLDYVFNQKNTQQDVYEEVSLLVRNMINETNICVIAYGQTNTGKTYTIEGPSSNFNNNRSNRSKENPGIVLRTAMELFQMAEENKQNQLTIYLSILEIYNDNIYNLLAVGTPIMNLFEGTGGNLQIPDLHPIKVTNIEETENLCKLSQKLRRTSHNLYNERSSRSHCIYTFYLKYRQNDKLKKSKMHIIDLAGSERITRSNMSNENLRKESININLSLNSLSNVLNSICLKQGHIPYRDSKLTHFLKESLDENFNILLLLQLSPNISDLSETISTLEFGSRIGKLCKYKTGSEKGRQNNHSLNRSQSHRSLRVHSLGPEKKFKI